MNVYRIVLIVLTLSFIGCGKTKSHEEIPIVEPQKEERIKHDDIEVIRLWGFEDACKNCNKGYRTELVCGYAYNPECAKLLNSISIGAELNASWLILQDISTSISEVQNGSK